MTNVFFLIKESVKDRIEKLKFDYLPFPIKLEDDELHLKTTIEWLEESCRNGKGGSSSHYSPLHGKWLDPFPETTGYIIPTLYDYSYYSNEKHFFELALKLTDWICEVQLENGACMQGNYSVSKGKTKPIVFNTGQNILGFIRSYAESGNEKYLQASVKAGDFLVASTDENGVWNKNLHRNLQHTINVRCSWSLLMLHKIVSKPEYLSVAEANLNWALEQQTDSGWFHHGASSVNGLPNTHFLSYTCEGFLESYRILKEKKYLEAAERTAFKMLKIFETRKVLYAFWDEKWKNHGKYFKKAAGKFICLTGCIQIATVWMQLFEETEDIRYLNSAFKMLDFVKTIQDITTLDKRIRGAIKGSFPIYGSYSALMYPNWAAKFFADALMLKIKLKKKILNENLVEPTFT